MVLYKEYIWCPTCFSGIRLIDTRHLCTRLRTDGIKSNVTWFLREQTSDKISQYNKSPPSLIILEDKKWRTFYIKDDNGKLWVEVIIVAFLDAVGTVDVLTPAIKNDVKHVEARTVHFSRPKPSFCFERISTLNGDYSYWQILSLVSPWNTTWRCFYPINHKERAKMADILNEVCQVVMKIKANQKRRNVFN